MVAVYVWNIVSVDCYVGFGSGGVSGVCRVVGDVCAIFGDMEAVSMGSAEIMVCVGECGVRCVGWEKRCGDEGIVLGLVVVKELGGFGDHFHSVCVFCESV